MQHLRKQLAMTLPNEVWAQSGDEWFKLTGNQWYKFSYKDIEVIIKTNANAKGVYVTSPTQQLNAVSA
jgi:alpha-galactosidase